MNAPIERIYVVAATKKPRVQEALDRFLPWIRERAEVYIEIEDGETSFRAVPSGTDCALVFGGDGTMLIAARHFAPLDIPVFGINLGKFGFLTQATTDEAFGSLEKLFEGRYEIAERMMISCALRRDGSVIHCTPALNDAVISRTALSRLLTIDLLIDDRWVNTYRSDGLIVATPVGSTAHSLAASGPILTPEMTAFIICPICPHTLSHRPVVISGDTLIRLRPRDYSEQPALTVDGQIFKPLGNGDVIEIKKSDRSLRLIKTGERSFFETLREKLGWSGQISYVNG